jgi:hypothetical protein
VQPRYVGRLLTLVLATTPALGAASLPGSPAALSPEGLRADARLLRRALEELHPGLLRYQTKDEAEAAFRRLDAELDAARTLPAAYLAISRLLAGIRCGHTYANFFNQPDSVAQEVLRRHGRVPFHFRWLDGRMLVTRDLSAQGALRPGSQVVSIDGVPAATILERLLPFVRADGGNDAQRVAELEVDGRDAYEAFDVFFPLVFPPRHPRFELELRAPGEARTRRLSVSALSADTRAPAGEGAGDGTPGWKLRFLEGSHTARLDMPTWVTYKSRWDWRAFLDEAFAQLHARGARHLVIDLRGNQGGTSEVGSVLLSHLTRRELPLTPLEPRVRYRQVPTDLLPHLDTWDPGFKDWGDAAQPLGNGFFKLVRPGDTGESVVRPAARPFSGRVYVLVGADNSSATFTFAAAAQKHGLATLVGQPTGGNRRGTNGGAIFFLRLPHSRIEVDVPLIGSFALTPEPDEGVRPDVLVLPTEEDVAGGADSEWAAVLRLITASESAPNQR